MEDGFTKAEQLFTAKAKGMDSEDRSGSCGLVLILKNSAMHIGNVGDCRAIELSGNLSRVRQLTRDHKPNDD